MSKILMIQGTMSSAGKSLITAGLCRVFARKGYRVAPFKSQNMSLNSFITDDGLEMGRAQVMQAEAAGIRPQAAMNPILLKPSNDVASQVIVNGKVRANLSAREYFRYKKSLVPDIIAAFRSLEKQADLILVEGAGSPAEINLKQDDIVNMGLAKLLGSNVLLVGDIDRGGVFAQLYGTAALLEPDEQARLRGLIINKFRGDKSILDPGIAEIERRTGIPVLGVIPYLHLSLDDEDSLSARLETPAPGSAAEAARQTALDIAVIRLPHISNFTDFDVFDEFADVSVRFADDAGALGHPDLVCLPGSKNTLGDLAWLKQRGLADAVRRLARDGVPIIGICGGYQMLGQSVSDPERVETPEGAPNEAAGLGLLPAVTVLAGTKTTRQTHGVIPRLTGTFAGMSGKPFEGYEIHMGVTTDETKAPAVFLSSGNVLGTYIHGLFDKKESSEALVNLLYEKKKKTRAPEREPILDYREFRESQYDRLADALEKHMDIDAVQKLFVDAAI
jgi:adenosylcobyric acid synthase